MVDYRPVPEEDLDAFRRVLDYAFRPEAGPNPDPDHAGDPSRVGDRRGLYDGDALVTTAGHHDLTVSVRGEWCGTTGLSAVATRPEHRRQGLVRRLLRASLTESREAGRPFSLLWPFKHAFYRRFGWGRLGGLGRYELEPGVLSPVADHHLVGGAFRRLEADDYPELQDVDERYADRFDLAMRRSEDWYRHRFFEGWEGQPFVYGWERDGQLRGYLRYDVEHDDDRLLRVTDFGAPDAEATVNLYRFLYHHEGQADEVRIYAPPDDRLFDLLEEPRAVDLSLRPGPMGRLVDVPTAVETLPAPEGVEASLTLEVTDELCDWNDGTFGVQAAAGAFTVQEGPGDGPRVELPIETLSRLAFGGMTAERAALAGGLDADSEAVARLGTLFPPRDVYLREFF